MTKIIGLRTTLYIFETREAFQAAKDKFFGLGTITEVFVNSKYAFEFRRDRFVH